VTLPWPALAFAMFAVFAPAATFAEPAKVSDLVDDLQRIQLKIAQGQSRLPRSAHSVEGDRRGDRGG
jgi:hypothetical protein